jgi:hypothetical protein
MSGLLFKYFRWPLVTATLVQGQIIQSLQVRKVDSFSNIVYSMDYDLRGDIPGKLHDLSSRAVIY